MFKKDKKKDGEKEGGIMSFFKKEEKAPADDGGLSEFKEQQAEDAAKSTEAESKLITALKLAQAKLARWKLKGTISVEVDIVLFSLGVEVEVDRIEQASALAEQGRAMLEEAEDWGTVEINESNSSSTFIRLKPTLTHSQSNEPLQKARSDKWAIRKLEDGLAKLRQKLIKACKQMQAAGFSGSVSGAVKVKVPSIVAFGENISISISVSCALTDMIASMNLLEEENLARAKGQLFITAHGANVPPVDDGSADPYAIFAIKGGKIEDVKRTKTLKRTVKPEWEEAFPPVPCAPSGETLVVTVYDFNKIQQDFFIDEAIIPLDKLKIKPNVETHIVADFKGASQEWAKDIPSIHFSVKWVPTGL